MNDKEVRVLELDKYEYGIVVNALNEFRNKILSKKEKLKQLKSFF